MAKYEFDGDKYLKASKHQKEWGQKLIKEMNISTDANVLDLGCGDGLLTRMLKDIAINGYVLGVDASEGMISKAKEYKVENLDFIQLNIDDIDFEEEFSIIISNATLHWVENHNKLLENCFNALKADGVLRFNFAGEGNCSNFFKVIKSKIKSEEYKSYFKNFEWPWFMPSQLSYKELINKNNYSEFKVWEENADRYFSDEQEMIRWIDQPSIVPFLKYIDEEDARIRFRDEVVKEMVELTKKDDGRCFETFRRINVFAKK